jgi:hypothetical protein
MVRDMILEYNYPDIECKKVILKEQGLFSSSREYMLISRKDFNYYVCACPYGKSFFISWWLKEQEDTLNATVAKMGALGRWFSGHDRSKTFYELDSQLMFSNSINTILKRAVDKVLLEKGFKNPATQPADTTT